MSFTSMLLRIFFGSIVLCVVAVAGAQDKSAPATDKWEKEIAAFEASDRESPPIKGGVLFIGSSSIRLWDLEKSFPGAKFVNRGFGGSQIHDSVKYAPRIVFPHEPKSIFFYAGDNDIGSGKTPDVVVGNFKEFVKVVHERLPATTIHFIAIKPSPSRWKFIEKQQEANQRIAEYCRSYQPAGRLIYVDVVKPMLGDDGQPRGDLFRSDKLHLNDEGYKLWKTAILPLLPTSAVK